MFYVLFFDVLGKLLITCNMFAMTIPFCTATILISHVAAKCPVCPQGLVDDTQLAVCATNSYGNISVTQSQIANWNCNNPNNRT